MSRDESGRVRLQLASFWVGYGQNVWLAVVQMIGNGKCHRYHHRHLFVPGQQHMKQVVIRIYYSLATDFSSKKSTWIIHGF